ncbi:MAG: type II methionyl aminopeptidase [Candidatus Pacearchaeota archaeon]
MIKKEELEHYRKAGQIAKKIKEYCKDIIRKDMLLIDIAEKIENKIIELGAKPAFPVDLSINEIAAHYSPLPNEKEIAKGLLKIDIGISINGYIVDTAIALDLENNEINKKLIKSSEIALNEAIKVIKKDIEIREIGKIISEKIKEFGFSPIINLAGHEIKHYLIHAGITIPNYDNNNKNKLKEGIYAIEPFSTTGEGRIYESKGSGIYSLINLKSVRSKEEKEILSYIEKEYKTLPFSSRWIVKKFGNKSLVILKFLESQGIIKEYPILIEKSHNIVSQAENTIYFDGEKVEILT